MDRRCYTSSAVMEVVRSLFTSAEYERWVQEAAQDAHAARVRAATRDDERAALEAEVRAAEKRVENVVESIATIGSNDILAARFRFEEKKLLDARQRLAALPSGADAAPVPVVSTAQVLKLMDRLDAAVEKKPTQAKETLASFIESIVLTPGADGYSGKLTLKNKTGRPFGGGLFHQVGCGARI